MNTHIERMEQELSDLQDKIKKGTEFLKSEQANPRFTNETQRHFLWEQLAYMSSYRDILKKRIEFDKERDELLKKGS